MMPDYPLEETLDFKFTTRAFATGIPTVLAGTPVVEIYEDNSVTQITAAETLTVDFDSIVGLNNLRIVATAANGFESGKSYAAILSAGTVGGVSVVGEVVAQFSVERSPALRPTTAGRTLTVEADGDLTKVNTLDGHTAQTADHTAAIADVPTVAEFNARTLVAASYFDPAADAVANVTLVATTTTNTDVRGTNNAATSAKQDTMETTLNDVPTTAEFNARTILSASYFDPAADAVANVTLVATTTTNTDMVGTDSAATEAKQDIIDTNVDAILVDTADMQPKLGTPVADVSADIAAVKAETVLIVADTNELQTDWTNGGRLDLLLDAIKVITDAMTAEAAANFAKTLSNEGSVNGTASGVPTTTTIPASNLSSSVNDFYNGAVMIILTGALAGQRTDVTDYVGSTKVLTVTATTTAMSASDTFILL